MPLHENLICDHKISRFRLQVTECLGAGYLRISATEKKPKSSWVDITAKDIRELANSLNEAADNLEK